MGNRIDLHNRLIDVLGSRNVYFQPPASLKMSYPCIVYKLDGMDEKFADDILYVKKRRYTITIIDSNPDSLIPDKLSVLKFTTFENHYCADNLNHYVYLTYF